MREIFDRYGPAIAVVAVLVLLVVLAPADGPGSQDVAATGDSFDGTDAAGGRGGSDTSTGFGTDDTSDVGGSGEFGGGGGTSGTGGTGSSTGGNSGAGGPGTSGSGTAGPGGGAPPANTVCREDGAMPSFSFYAPPCVPIFSGDNGGATHKGVTADEIRLVYYFPNSSAATEATLRAIGADDPRPQTMETARALTQYFNQHYETYGRDVKVAFFESSAATDDEAALRADAVKIDNDLKPFAVIGAASVTATELAARGIICVCTTSEPAGFYQQNAPHVYSILPQLEEYYQQMAEYIGKRLAGKPAAHTGTVAGVPTDQRRFGLIYIEGVGNRLNPRAKDAVAYYEKELARYGVKLAAKVAYTYDAAQGQSQATNLIAQMKAAGVNNIACVCDPIYPIFLTKAATQNQYFPEWFITGTALTDTTFFGRTYDQAQWANAFGISPLPVPAANLQDTAPYQEFHHARPNANDGDEGTQILVREPAFSLLFSGIHRAGPNLKPATMAQGFWDAPFLAGPVGTVGIKLTPNSYSVIADFTEVFWDSSGRGRDEVGNEGAGRMLKVDGAKRYTPGEWPAGDPKVFQSAGTVYSVDGKTYFDHAGDGHTHDPKQRCRSCR
ncbi:MAG TPA: hypothetical protein VMN58_00325 [Acidimicrobiales bacterium]|nr:hypothetical protein [Acidimicrobiales bacterium]